MAFLVWLIVLAFLALAGYRIWWVRDLGPEPTPKNEDHPDWLRCRYLGEVD